MSGSSYPGLPRPFSSPVGRPAEPVAWRREDFSIHEGKALDTEVLSAWSSSKDAGKKQQAHFDEVPSARRLLLASGDEELSAFSEVLDAFN